ncbi:bifunctional tryptophan synthase trp1 [Gaertneriomyces sp. JEL0708]|nr:bifunctional tryptophan synthase trp1 [Gaertneriomyces sp. JEL0708]
MTTLLIDNYDSFTYNVYQFLASLGADVVVHRNDQITLQECIDLNPRNIVISPGPGRPADAGISNDVIRHFMGKIPIMGVCLGEQCVYEIFGGVVTYAGEIVHGKTSPIKHDGRGLYEGVHQQIECTRYHSLAGDPKTLPESLEITSWTESGVVMGVRHKEYVIEGVQYHPESIASEMGRVMFGNFLMWEGGKWSDLVKNEKWVKKDVMMSGAEGVDSNVVGGGKRGDVFGGVPLSSVSKMNSTGVVGRENVGVDGRGKETEFDGGGLRHAEDSPKKKTSTILERIHIQRQIDIEETSSKPGQSLEDLEKCIALGLAPKQISFPDRLLRSAHPVAVLAEIKRASPSKGDIAPNVHAPSQALLYARAGAATISVLTEPRWFKGHVEDMRLVRVALDTVTDRPAVLRKDFVCSRYQIAEGRLNGADTVLLIVAMLTDPQLADLLNYSRSLGMEPLVEVANAAEMERALKAGSKVIGVNNRDLHSFEVDMQRTTSLAGMVSDSVILIALSGITGRKDVEGFVSGGARGVLVGEALMRAGEAQIGSFVRELMLRDETGASDKPSTVFKICGVTNVEDANLISASGAHFIGVIFAAVSKRRVEVDSAISIVKAVHGGRNPIRNAPSLPSPSSSVPSTSWFRTTTRLLHDTAAKHGPLVVGVFQDQPVEYIIDAVRRCGLDCVQLHGDENAGYIQQLVANEAIQGVWIWKVVHIPTESTAEDLTGLLPGLQPAYHIPLLDTTVTSSTAQIKGGTGTTFNHAISFELHSRGIPHLVAGGLGAHNVGQLKGRVWGVDVCSGVEVAGEPRRKDAAKVTEVLAGCKQSAMR